MSSYDLLAAVYEDFEYDSFSRKMVPYIMKILRKRTLKGMRVIDLACGTGAAAIEMSKLGAEVTGIDSSSEMLKYARRKSKKSRRKIAFSRQELTEFGTKGEYDLITCLFDSLNHVTEKDDLQQVFSCVASKLKPKGKFIFDVNVAYGFRRNWGGSTIVRESPKFYTIWEGLYDSPSGLAKMNVTVFQKSGNQIYKKCFVSIKERAYKVNTLKSMLSKAGLTVNNMYGSFKLEKPSRTSGRVLFVCKKI